MVKKIAFLEYNFMFDPQTTWDSVTDFERDLADFFSAHGLYAELLNNLTGKDKRRFFIERLESNFEPDLKALHNQGPQSTLIQMNKNLQKASIAQRK